MDTQGANKLVVLGKMMLGEAITTIGFPRGPTDIELFLADVVEDPAVVHVNGLGACLFARFIENCIGSGVVHLDRGGWLGMAHLS